MFNVHVTGILGGNLLIALVQILNVLIFDQVNMLWKSHKLLILLARPPTKIILRYMFCQSLNFSLLRNQSFTYLPLQDGIGGKKILAAFTANLADFAGVPSSRWAGTVLCMCSSDCLHYACRHALSMNLEPMSKKIARAMLGVTIEAEFIKHGQAE